MKRPKANGWYLITALLAALIFTVSGCGSQPTASAPDNASQANTASAGISPEEVAKYWEQSMAGDNNAYLISAEDLKKALDAKEDIFVLDVRRAEDYDKEGHIPGAVNIPYPEVGKNLDKLPKDKKIAVVCYTGHWAGNTAAVLRVLGYNSYNLRFGMSGWNPNNNKLLTKDKTPNFPTITGSDPGNWGTQ